MSIHQWLHVSTTRVEHYCSPRNLWFLGTMMLVGILIWLSYTSVLPISPVYFVFYSVIIFLGSLARPSWFFLLFVALLPLEITRMAPESFGFDLRPYQWVGGLLGVAIGIRLLKPPVIFPFVWNIFDTLLALFVGGVLISAVFNQGLAIKQSVVVLSFFGLYCLARIFFKSWEDVRLALLFFLPSAFLAIGWGIAQNILFLTGQEQFSVMPGRPNGTLAEPDWLGLFVMFLFIPLLIMIKKRFETGLKAKTLWVPWLALVVVFVVLILTVSRSAWLATLFLLACSFFFIFLEKNSRTFQFQTSLRTMQFFTVAFVVSLLLVKTIPLTHFELINRVQSTATHLQEITLACPPGVYPPQRIETLADLIPYDCLHIPLEEKASYGAAGKFITTTLRPDPNVSIRKSLYQTAWSTLREHPVLGIGWGNIGPRLGVDERGASYNASNLWLDVWLGGGLLSVFSLLAFFGWASFSILRLWWQGKAQAIHGALLALVVGFLVFNLFNTGLLLGFVWVWLALFPLLFAQGDSLNKNE